MKTSQNSLATKCAELPQLITKFLRLSDEVNCLRFDGTASGNVTPVLYSVPGGCEHQARRSKVACRCRALLIQ